MPRDEKVEAFFAATELLGSLNDAVHRPFLTYAGTAPDATESLLVAASIRDTVERSEGFAAATGLVPHERFFTDPIVTVPVPITVEDDETFRNPLWRVPSLLWHPLAWLPYDQATRAWVQVADGEWVQETEREWAVRLAWELTATGLYDPVRGWVDVLALHGIDITSPEGQARISDWVAEGQSGDEVLDTVDITPFFDALDAVHGEGWGRQIMQDTFPIYQAAAWSVAARTLAAEAEAGSLGAAGGGEVDRTQLMNLLSFAYSWFELMPALEELDGISPAQLISDLADSVEESGRPEDVHLAISAFWTLLQGIREAVGDAEDQLEKAEAERLEQLEFAAKSFLSALEDPPSPSQNAAG
ncbi:hypothetical protein [Microbacterium enclense]|uniref:hypothetical protein n=1 Tax=Microbacterium enclense TaxID=993073 RepID=UPI003F7D9153